LNNFSNDNEKIIDTDFIEVNTEEILKDKEIKREPLFYTRVQVAKILGEKESTISYWGKEFQSLLNIKIINMTRKYTKTNIENLMFIQKLLREDGLTIEQVKQYCSEKGFNTEEGLVDGSNPLAIQTFISAMSVELDKKFVDMQNNIIKHEQEMIKSIKNEVSMTVDEIITEKMNEFKEDFTKEFQENNRIAQQSYDLIYKMEQRKKETEEQNQHQGLFSKWFGKKN
jgi:DNA-binding transcriptional MerR regulator